MFKNLAERRKGLNNAKMKKTAAPNVVALQNLRQKANSSVMNNPELDRMAAELFKAEVFTLTPWVVHMH